MGTTQKVFLEQSVFTRARSGDVFEHRQLDGHSLIQNNQTALFKKRKMCSQMNLPRMFKVEFVPLHVMNHMSVK